MVKYGDRVRVHSYQSQRRGACSWRCTRRWEPSFQHRRLRSIKPHRRQARRFRRSRRWRRRRACLLSDSTNAEKAGHTPSSASRASAAIFSRATGASSSRRSLQRAAIRGLLIKRSISAAVSRVARAFVAERRRRIVGTRVFAYRSQAHDSDRGVGEHPPRRS